MLGAVHVARSTGRTLAFAPSVMEPQGGSGNGETQSEVESPGAFAVRETDGGGRNRSSETNQEARDKVGRSRVWP